MSAAKHLIVGAGPVGTALALQLAARETRVRLVTRSGGGPQHPLVDRMAVDASDPAALTAAAGGVHVIYNCANPGDYTQWARAWPPLAASILHAAEATGAVLATLGNLYGYGPVDAPMTRDGELRPSDHKGALRARMWLDALEAHEAGRVRATEVRASDYLGPTAPVSSSIIAMYAASTLAGKPAFVFSDPDQPHSWSAVDDIATTLRVLAAEEHAWGSPWLVPSSGPVSIRELLTALGQEMRSGEPRLRRVPTWVLRAGGTIVPLLREVTGVLYQFDRPFLVDATETTELFGIEATPWETVVEQTARAWHARATSGR